jgi:hypothetical protein
MFQSCLKLNEVLSVQLTSARWSESGLLMSSFTGIQALRFIKSTSSFLPHSFAATSRPLTVSFIVDSRFPYHRFFLRSPAPH